MDNELLLQAQSFIERLSQRNKELQSTVKDLHSQNITMQPKAEFYDAVTSSDTDFDMSEVAKVLNFPNIGRNKLFEFLREEDILRDNNQPYQSFVDRGYFRMVEQKVTLPYGDTLVNTKTVVSQKGMDFIRRKLNERFTD